MKVLGVLLARGGSKGLPRKHLRELGGKPMLSYSLSAVKESQRLSKVVFSTDCPEMAALAKESGVEVPFVRPASLSTDTAATADVLEHALNFVEARGERFDAVMTLQATSPLRTAQHIDGAIEIFEKMGKPTLLAIKKQEYPPWWLFQICGDHLEPAFPYPDPKANAFRVGRQFFPQTYRPAGAIYLTRCGFLRESKMVYDPQNSAFFEMDSADAVSIDTELDLQLAQSILNTRK